MARDYKARKYITEQAAQCGDERISNALIRAFDMMYSNQDHNGCFSTSVALHVIHRSFGYDPKLCYGLCVSPSGKGMYHAWLELDGKVLDLAIYGNSHFSPYWIDEPLGPVVFEDYNDTMMHYGNHEFDEDWNGSMISKAVEMGSIAKYITNAATECSCSRCRIRRGYLSSLNALLRRTYFIGVCSVLPLFIPVWLSLFPA